MAKSKSALTTREMVVFAMLGTIMYISKMILEWAPNIHLLAMLTITYTLVYRKKALIPIYIYVMLTGVYAGFNAWWIPHLYLWTVLWGVTMLLPRDLPRKLAFPLYMIVCALHGLLYGTLYAPAQALFFGLNFKGMVAWIVAGLPYDAIHAVGNLAAATLVIPLRELLGKLEKGMAKN